MAITFPTLYLILIIFVIIQRVFELYVSKKNERTLKAKGGKIIFEKNYIAMVLLHSSWLCYLLYHAITSPIIYSPMITPICLFLFVIGQILRITTIKTLGYRWTTTIAVLPEKPVIKKGLFKWVRHPNYLGVCIEIFTLPAAVSLFLPALFFSIVNFISLFFRIKTEEYYLIKYSSYNQIFKNEKV